MPVLILRLRALLPALVLLGSPSLWSQSMPPLEKHHSPTLDEDFVAVTGSAGLLARHEVSVAQWQCFLKESGYAWDFKPHFPQQDNHPAVGISLQDARAFCNWLTRREQQSGEIRQDQLYRLPTREEWDAAIALNRMRKPDLTILDVSEDDKTHPWGLSWPPPRGAGNFAAESIPGYADEHEFTAPVGSYKASAEGLHDLAGNVWEWCWDPEIRAEQQGHLRGGSWAYFREECLRSTYSMAAPADLRAATIGLRCVFEDRVRSASMYTMLEASREKIRAALRREMLGDKVNPSDVDAMRRRLVSEFKANKSGGGGASKPVSMAKAGEPFTNSLGARFLPTAPGQLGAELETRLADVQIWLEETQRPWPQRPSFLTQGNHPAVGMSWEMAQAFCQWLTQRERQSGHLPAQAHYRLPTDLEWSQWVQLPAEQGADPAARNGGQPGHYPWPLHQQFPPLGQSVNLDASRLPGFSDGYAYTSPVDSESANALGLRGLGGNAAEWCADPWPERSDERVVRGGSWLSWQRESLLSSHRRHAAASQGFADIGLRLLLDLQPSAEAASSGR